MKSPNYKPLHLPPPDTAEKTLGQKILDFVFRGRSYRAQDRFLINQMKERRAPVPPEVWGSDSRRSEVATTISELIRDEVGWPNSHFMPNDALVLLFLNYPNGAWNLDGLEIDFVFMALEKIHELNTDDLAWDSLKSLTFGEVVDILIGLEPNPQVVKEKNTLWPSDGSDTLESMPCPTLATFLDLRAYVKRNEVEAPRITPTTRLNDLKNHKGLFSSLNGYIDRRFGIRGTLLPILECLDPMLLGLSSTFVVFVGSLALVAAIIVKEPANFYSSVWWIAVAFPLFALLVTSPLILYTLLSKSFWKLVLNKRPKPETVGALVKHILEERNPHKLPAA